MTTDSAPRARHARIAGIASYAPDEIITNLDMQRYVETTDEWIVQRTGIRERRRSRDDEYTSDLCFSAIKKLEEQTGPITDVDMIFVGTTTPDYLYPSVAAQLQEKLGIAGTGALDVTAACAGFAYGLNLADAMITSGQAKRVLVLGGEVLTKFIDYDDRATCILFGDGAGAALVEVGDATSKIEGTIYGADGSAGPHLFRCATRHEMLGVPEPTLFLRQNGREVYKWATRNIPIAVEKLMADAGVTKDDIDWFVPHSANLRIVEKICETVDIPLERTLTSSEYFGNTSSATIPLALAPAITDGRIKRGDRILLIGFGGGLVYAGTVLRW
jgi:3-oxoacyl-[acyl-carrier-protein] synthase-3